MRQLLLFIIVWTLVSVMPATPQEPAGPLSQSQLMEAIKAGGLSAESISAIIRRRGVEFEMSPDLERRFREAGAETGVILALWEKEQWNPPKGDPLTKDFVVGLLVSGTPPQRLSKWILSRKIGFELNPAAIKELKNAGASDEVIVLMTTNNLWVPPRKATYEETLAKAQAALKSGNFEAAENEANAAKLLDSARPEAFAVIGYVNLYRYNSFPKAASEYRSAIEKGGEVEFHVRHVDHVPKIGKAETCVGQLFLRKDGLTFRSSRTDHNLALSANQIVEARLVGPSAKNPLARSSIHLLTSHTRGKSAPIVFHADRDRGKNDKDEEAMIVDLINLMRR